MIIGTQLCDFLGNGMRRKDVVLDSIGMFWFQLLFVELVFAGRAQMQFASVCWYSAGDGGGIGQQSCLAWKCFMHLVPKT